MAKYGHFLCLAIDKKLYIIYNKVLLFEKQPVFRFKNRLLLGYRRSAISALRYLFSLSIGGVPCF